MWTETLCVTSKAKDLQSQVLVLYSTPSSGWEKILGLWMVGEQQGAEPHHEQSPPSHGISRADKEHPRRSVCWARNKLLYFFKSLIWGLIYFHSKNWYCNWKTVLTDSHNMCHHSVDSRNWCRKLERWLLMFCSGNWLKKMWLLVTKHLPDL